MDTVAKTICGAPGVDSESDKLCRFIAARYSISVVAPVQNTIFDETAKRTREFLERPQSGFRKRPIMSNDPYTSRTSVKGLEMIYALLVSGEVGRSWRYCNAKPTREKAGASS